MLEWDSVAVEGYKASIISTIVDSLITRWKGHGYKASIISTIVDAI